MGINELHPHFVVVMIKFMTNILVIKDICEIINDNLIIFKLFFIITNWTQKLGQHYYLNL